MYKNVYQLHKNQEKMWNISIFVFICIYLGHFKEKS